MDLCRSLCRDGNSEAGWCETGCEAACTAHLLRVQGKQLVRLLYRHCEQGHTVPPMLFDLANLLSGYFFFLALKLNELEGVDEVPYVSRNY